MIIIIICTKKKTLGLAEHIIELRPCCICKYPYATQSHFIKTCSWSAWGLTARLQAVPLESERFPLWVIVPRHLMSCDVTCSWCILDVEVDESSEVLERLELRPMAVQKIFA